MLAEACWAEVERDMLAALEQEARVLWESAAYDVVGDQAQARRLAAYQYWRISRHVTDADAAPSWEPA